MACLYVTEKRKTDPIWDLQLFGYDQGLMSGIISAPQFTRVFPQVYQESPDDVHAGTIQGTVTGEHHSIIRFARKRQLTRET